ncbi:MAG: hypothetical protein JWP89_2515 [Schlesneria sp.]|nr:hypothetical protein [Schlesneria sp.]
MNCLNYRILALALILCLFVGCASAGRQSVGGYEGGDDEPEDSLSVFDFL